MKTPFQVYPKMKKAKNSLDIEERLRILANLLIDRVLEDKRKGRLLKFGKKKPT